MEAVFGAVGYLPYASNDQDDFFYQGLLFNSCLSARQEVNNVVYDPQLCTVKTANNQDYTVTINSGYNRSDGNPVTLEDVFFTFQNIIKSNTWARPRLDTYRSLEIKKLSDTSIQVTFPYESVDNMIFFTNYILPQHILANTSYDDYVNTYGRSPVASNCAAIQKTVNDPDSLVFDLSKCDYTNVMFYQLKRFTDFTAFQNYVKAGGLIHFYEHPIALEGYDTQQLLNSDLETIFFNTQSKLLSPQIDRSLAGFISSKFYGTGYTQYLYKNQFVFDKFLSDGTGIQANLAHMGTNKSGTVDLSLLNIQPLPKAITITTGDRKFVYTLSQINGGVFNLQINLDYAYPRIQIVHDSDKAFEPSTYDKTKKVTFYNLVPGDTIKPGHNQYKIYALEKNSTKQNYVAMLDIRYMTDPQKEAAAATSSGQKISVIYYDEPTSDFVVQRLQALFAQYKIDNYFDFMPFTSAEEFQGKIASQDYDVVIRSIRRGLKQDISNLFLTDSPLVNPSLYVNQSLASLITEYLGSSDNNKVHTDLKANIDSIYAKDAPLVVLGQPYVFVHYNKGLNVGSGQREYLTSFKQDILTNTHLVEHILPDKVKFFTRQNMTMFLQNALHGEEKPLIVTDDTTGANK